MSKENKKTSGTISRREFLRNAGIVVGSTAISSAFFLSACGKEVEVTKIVTTTAPGTTSTITKTAADNTVTVTKYTCPVCNQEFDTLGELKTHFDAEHSRVLPASQRYLVVDSIHCAGCMTCMAVCSLVHDGKVNLSHSRIQISQDAFNQWPADIIISQCRQCVDPLCVRNCPTGACHVDTKNGNIRVIDDSICIGCQTCIQVCPFIPHRTIWNNEKKKAMKCDLCSNTPYWDEAGGPNGKQACVEFCPNKVLKLVNIIPSQMGTSGYDCDFTAISGEV